MKLSQIENVNVTWVHTCNCQLQFAIIDFLYQSKRKTGYEFFKGYDFHYSYLASNVTGLQIYHVLVLSSILNQVLISSTYHPAQSQSELNFYCILEDVCNANYYAALLCRHLLEFQAPSLIQSGYKLINTKYRCIKLLTIIL